jgi:hypothetical protein
MLKEGGYLSPIIFQVVGLVILIGSVVYWVFTGKSSPLFVGAALSLIAYGSAGGAIVTLRHDTKKKAEEAISRVEKSKEFTED